MVAPTSHTHAMYAGSPTASPRKVRQLAATKVQNFPPSFTEEKRKSEAPDPCVGSTCFVSFPYSICEKKKISMAHPAPPAQPQSEAPRWRMGDQGRISKRNSMVKIVAASYE